MTNGIIGTVLLVAITITAGALAATYVDMGGEGVPDAEADVSYAAVREDPTTQDWFAEQVRIEDATVSELYITTNGTTYILDVSEGLEFYVLCPTAGGWTLHDGENVIEWSAMSACGGSDYGSPTVGASDDADNPTINGGDGCTPIPDIDVSDFGASAYVNVRDLVCIRA